MERSSRVVVIEDSLTAKGVWLESPTVHWRRIYVGRLPSAVLWDCTRDYVSDVNARVDARTFKGTLIYAYILHTTGRRLGPCRETYMLLVTWAVSTFVVPIAVLQVIWHGGTCIAAPFMLQHSVWPLLTLLAW